MEENATVMKQTIYENDPGSKKLLAWRIHTLGNRFIHKIKDMAAELTVVSDFLPSLDLASVGAQQNHVPLDCNRSDK